MNEEIVKRRIDTLLSGGSANNDAYSMSQELFQGTLGVMTSLYGHSSPQLQNFIKETDDLRKKFVGMEYADSIKLLSQGALRNIKSEIEAGFIDSFIQSVTGELLTDFLELARVALAEKGDNAKNVAAVLSAALFEDTVRRLASANNIPHIEKLRDVIIELKNNGILHGSQVGIATSYLNFRNNSLHAQWDMVERESVASVLGFVEQLITKHF